MKKNILPGLLCLLILLSGCEGPESPENRMDSPAQASTAEAAVLPAETFSEPERETYPPEVQAEVMLEGDLQPLTLVLWEEPGYLIYFPENQWILEHLQEEGRTVDRWEPALNPDITLRVVHLGQAPQEDADSYMAALFGSFHSEGWENGRYEGADTQAFRLLRARLITGGKNYLLLAEYPYEGAEGFGAHLEPVMDSFRILPD